MQQFSECLPALRKGAGLNQEELAEKIGVSRQAVSKWETGEAQPELSKLTALADALGVSIDRLCGRPDAAPPAEAAAPSDASATAYRRNPRKTVLYCALCVLLAGVIAAAAFFIGAETEKRAYPLPDIIEVSGVTFFSTADGVNFSFIPSFAAEGSGYRYTISFTNTDGLIQTYDAPCADGVCSGIAVLSSHSTFLVSVTVSNGRDLRSVAVASGMHFTTNGWSGTIID